MCGISGIINSNGFQILSIQTMTDTIRHRGPDGEGFVLFNNKGAKISLGGNDTSSEVWEHSSAYKPSKKISETQGIFQVGFGHRRLSILDLSPSGHQPMSFKDDRYWITYNGEVYNYKELRAELKVLGHHFYTESDTEVILAAYSQWGEDCLHKFNGMWAFAIYDSRKKNIFMARDRFGIKPFYYWISPDGSFNFASEIKQFTCLPGWEAKINSQRAYDYLVYAFTDHTNETMFDGVYQIPGGYFYSSNIDSIKVVSGRQISCTKWYHLKYNQFNGSFDQASNEFNRLFKSAVDLHLRADVPVGSALSGGLDSSAIVCEVNNILGSQGVRHLQQTFSSCSTDPRYDEKKWMDIVVAHTAVDAHFVYPKYEDIFDVVPKLTWQHDEPFQSLSPYLSFHIFQSAVNNGVKVLLNGQGADEYLGGYGQFTNARYIEKFLKLKWKSLILDIKLSRKYKPVSYLSIIKNMISSVAPDFIKHIFSNSLGNYNQVKSIINNAALGLIELPTHPYDSIPVKYGTVPEISEFLTFYSTLPKFLKWEDRNSMANSVEARVPFLDYRLVEFTYNLPNDYLDFGGETKRVLRDGLKDLLPPPIRNRKDKMGYITPEERWVKEDNPVLFRLKIIEAIENSDGIIKPEALLFFDNVVKGKIPFDYTYWRLIQFAEWMKQFNIKSAIIPFENQPKKNLLN